jgi:hypothetical protein
MPWAYYLAWVTVVGLVSGVADRYYLGLEWFRLVSGGRWIVVVVAISVGILSYFLWLWSASRTEA